MESIPDIQNHLWITLYTLERGWIYVLILLFQINVLGLSMCTREAVKSMRARNIDDGHIINICRYITKTHPAAFHNPKRTDGAFISQLTKASLVPEMAWCQFGTKLLSKQISLFCQFDSYWEHTSVDYDNNENKHNDFLSKKCVWRCNISAIVCSSLFKSNRNLFCNVKWWYLFSMYRFKKNSCSMMRCVAFLWKISWVYDLAARLCDHSNLARFEKRAVKTLQHGHR